MVRIEYSEHIVFTHECIFLMFFFYEPKIFFFRTYWFYSHEDIFGGQNNENGALTLLEQSLNEQNKGNDSNFLGGHVNEPLLAAFLLKIEIHPILMK